MTRDKDTIAQEREEIKYPRGPLGWFLRWIDCHPRTGWYIVAVGTANLLLNIVDLFH